MGYGVPEGFQLVDQPLVIGIQLLVGSAEFLQAVGELLSGDLDPRSEVRVGLIDPH